MLTDKQKIAYRLNRAQGVPQLEIAQALRISPASVCRLVSRAEDKIARLLKNVPPDMADIFLEIITK